MHLNFGLVEVILVRIRPAIGLKIPYVLCDVGPRSLRSPASGLSKVVPERLPRQRLIDDFAHMYQLTWHIFSLIMRTRVAAARN